ncbi:MAG: hypothetical protein CL840_21360 [Crocinitomicaceae bacterium]|nr:hypothetical protein [Crocinitomicaceae bacterium]|tara:strand:- start:2233 stop:2697 length:465 start_codon:yes stop_codon:yes gene_type:complete
MKELDPSTFESSELMEETFRFWFADNEHIRTPFPSYIRDELKQRAIAKFYDWANGLHDKAKDEVNDELIGEKFEEIIFETASSMVLTEDERLTILYPFLPRMGDKIYEDAQNEVGLSEVVDRMMFKEKDHSYFKIKLKKEEDQQVWETEFALPV